MYFLSVYFFFPLELLQLLSGEGATLEFCEAIRPLLTSLNSTVKIAFMDDVTLSGELQTMERDLRTVLDASQDA